MVHPFLIGDKTYLREFEESDITEEYIEWLSDPQVTRFLGKIEYQPTASDVKTWLERHQDNTTNLAFAIIGKGTDSHVGTVSLDNIHWVHRRAEIDLKLGLKASSVQNCGEEALSLTIDYAFQRIGLHKILHTCLADETDRIRLIEKLGFKLEVLFRQHVYVDAEYHDLASYGLLSHELKRFRL